MRTDSEDIGNDRIRFFIMLAKTVESYFSLGISPIFQNRTFSLFSHMVLQIIINRFTYIWRAQ